MNAETIIRELLRFYFSVYVGSDVYKPSWDFDSCSPLDQCIIGSQENLNKIKNWVENEQDKD